MLCGRQTFSNHSSFQSSTSCTYVCWQPQFMMILCLLSGSLRRIHLATTSQDIKTIIIFWQLQLIIAILLCKKFNKLLEHLLLLLCLYAFCRGCIGGQLMSQQFAALCATKGDGRCFKLGGTKLCDHRNTVLSPAESVVSVVAVKNCAPPLHHLRYSHTEATIALPLCS